MDEPGDQLSISRLRVHQDRELLFHQRQLRHPIGDFGKSVPVRFYRTTQNTQYGQLANWGYQNPNDLGTTAARDAEPVESSQIQRLLPVRARRGLLRQPQHPSSVVRNKQPGLHPVASAVAGYCVRSTDQTCSVDSCVSNFPLRLQSATRFIWDVQYPLRPFRFQSLLQRTQLELWPADPSAAPSDEVSCNLAATSRTNKLETANSWYNALQIRFEKRTTHHVSFDGSYTISKATDDSSARPKQLGPARWVRVFCSITCLRNAASAPATRHSGWRLPWLWTCRLAATNGLAAI